MQRVRLGKGAFELGNEQLDQCTSSILSHAHLCFELKSLFMMQRLVSWKNLGSNSCSSARIVDEKACIRQRLV